MAVLKSWLTLGILVFFLLLICIDLTDSRGARGGSRSSRTTYRSTSRTTYRSSTTYRSTSRTYKSSFRGTYRGGASFYSRYVRYVPSMRYSRAYTAAYLGAYAYYYNMYFTYAATYAALRRSRNYNDVNVCVNYEANGNDTAIGIFACPLPIEPKYFTACCGNDYAQFCCEPKNKNSANKWTWAWIFILILVIVMFAVMCNWMSIRRRCYDEPAVIHETTRTTVIQQQTVNPQPPVSFTNYGYHPNPGDHYAPPAYPPNGAPPGYPPNGAPPGYPPNGAPPGYPPNGAPPAYPANGYPPPGPPQGSAPYPSEDQMYPNYPPGGSVIQPVAPAYPQNTYPPPNQGAPYTIPVAEAPPAYSNAYS